MSEGGSNTRYFLMERYKSKWRAGGIVGKVGIIMMVASGIALLTTSFLTVRVNVVPLDEGLTVVGLSAIAFFFGLVTRLVGGLLTHLKNRKSE